MNNLDHISESLEIIFGAKILKCFDADPGWEKIRIRDKHPGSATLVKIHTPVLIHTWNGGGGGVDAQVRRLEGR
jgi:hypothetical protein